MELGMREECIGETESREWGEGWGGKRWEVEDKARGREGKTT